MGYIWQWLLLPQPSFRGNTRTVDDACNRETEGKRDIGSEREEEGWEGKEMEKGRERCT